MIRRALASACPNTPYTLPAAEVTRKTITIDGKPLGLVVVKPPGSAGKT